MFRHVQGIAIVMSQGLSGAVGCQSLSCIDWNFDAGRRQDLCKHAYYQSPTPNTSCVQTGVPMTALSVVGAQWRLRPQDRRLLWGTFMPWAVRAGARCPDLLTLYYEKHFEVC